MIAGRVPSTIGDDLGRDIAIFRRCGLIDLLRDRFEGIGLEIDRDSEGVSRRAEGQITRRWGVGESDLRSEGCGRIRDQVGESALSATTWIGMPDLRLRA